MKSYNEFTVNGTHHFLRDHIRRVQAVVFDMDGVLVDSERHHFLAHQRALREFGVEIDKSFYIAHGVSTDPVTFYAKAFSQERLPFEYAKTVVKRKRQIYQELQEREGVVANQPAVALVKALYERRVPLAIASAVPREEVGRIVQHLTIDCYFEVVAAGDDVPLRNKPLPDIYLKAAELLGVSPVECLALEDSGNGAAAAIGAGMTCFVVPNEYTRSHDFSGALVFDSFSEVEKMLLDEGEQNCTAIMKRN